MAQLKNIGDAKCYGNIEIMCRLSDTGGCYWEVVRHRRRMSFVVDNFALKDEAIQCALETLGDSFDQLEWRTRKAESDQKYAEQQVRKALKTISKATVVIIDGDLS